MFREIASYVFRCPFDHFFPNFVVSFLIFFGLWAQNFHSFDEVFPAGLSKLHSKRPGGGGGKFWDKTQVFGEICYICSFSMTLTEIFGNFYKQLGRL